MIAYAEARTVAPDDQDLTIVSLGTGVMTEPLPYDDARSWGLVRWARPILDIVFDGVSDTVDYEVRLLSADSATGARLYWRLQPTLGATGHAIDDASRTNIDRLKTVARRFIDDHTQDLDAIAEAVR